MTTKKRKSDDAVVFDISQFREETRYVWRDIEREAASPLRVKLRDLSIRQTNEIPWGLNVTLQESFKAIAQYVVEWSLEAENIETGDTVSVPPPAVAGWEVFELIGNTEASHIINWLKIPHYMKAEAEKKLQKPSKNTTE